MTAHVTIKRAYDEAHPSDGYRVFVDRLWPRGVSKQNLKFDAWCKDLAPTVALRVWFGHKIEHWDEFKQSYQTELRSAEQQARMREVLGVANGQLVTLVYAAKDPLHNHALILAEEMNKAASAKRKVSLK